MNRCYPGWMFTVVIAVAATAGCGGSAETTASKAAESPSAAASPVAAPPAAPDQPEVEPATEVVSRFLDSIRRGGAQAEAGRLMTEKAQAECRRTGLVVQPIGSPDAHFEVTRSQPVPGEDDAVLVHSLWREPDGTGQQVSYQVVWALRREPVGWRISGLVMELQEGAEPLVVDFESGASLAAMMGEDRSAAPTVNSGSDADPAARQATVGEAAVER